MILDKNKEKLIFFIGLIFGLISIILFGDKTLDNEWVVMVRNLEDYKILSSRKIDDEWVPNLFMPPLYPYFLYYIKKIFIFSKEYYVNFCLLIQLIIFLVSINIFKKILIEIFLNKKISIIGMFAFTIFPLNIYSVSQISSIGLQIFLSLLFIYNFILFFKYSTFINLVYFSIVSGLLMLLRGEFFVFFLFTLAFFVFKRKKIYLMLSSILIVLIVLSPYLIRNYKIFNTLALTKSTGFNLLKGNNPKSKVEGIGMWYGYDVVPELEKELQEVASAKDYDLISDKIFLNYAIKLIKDDPARYIVLYIKKFFSFLFIDLESTYPGYYSILNIVPKMLISSLAIISIFFSFSKRIDLFNYFATLYILHPLIFSFFFILPRYTLSVLPIQIILSLFLYEKYLIFKKNKK